MGEEARISVEPSWKPRPGGARAPVATRSSLPPSSDEQRHDTLPSPALVAAPPRSAAPAEQVLTVARLDRLIKRVLDTATADVRVRGEVSGLHRAGSGHLYFSLKDEKEDAIIDCVMYRSAPAGSRKRVRDGEVVVLAGRVTLYPPRGRLQFIAERVLQAGRGALLEAVDKLKRQLAAEGLFAAERKRPLPAAPRRVAVLTSRDGAAIHDVVRVAFRRGPVRLLLIPTPVQGAGAAARIARAIALADGLADVDIIVVTRGGGSVEDLAAYNDERVVRAVAACATPVVSAVGHEIDTSLCDLAADVRAATPSHAAELLVADQGEQRRQLQQWQVRLRRGVQHQLGMRRQHLTELRARLGEPRRLVLEQAQRFDELSARLERAMRRDLARRRGGLEGLSQRLSRRDPRRGLQRARLRLGELHPCLRAAIERHLQRARRRLVRDGGRLSALSPLAVLQRGYAIVQRPDGRVVRAASEVAPAQALAVRFGRGTARVNVVAVSPDAESVPNDEG